MEERACHMVILGGQESLFQVVPMFLCLFYESDTGKWREMAFPNTRGAHIDCAPLQVLTELFSCDIMYIWGDHNGISKIGK